MTTATSALDRVREARAALDTAKTTLLSEAREAVNDALKELFADETVQTVRWAQKSSEYNDEGMYPGVAGPVVNFAGEDYGDHWEWLAGYNYSGPEDNKAKNLKAVLELIGEEILSDVFGEENIVTVSRVDGGVTIDTEYAGY